MYALPGDTHHDAIREIPELERTEPNDWSDQEAPLFRTIPLGVMIQMSGSFQLKKMEQYFADLVYKEG